MISEKSSPQPSKKVRKPQPDSRAEDKDEKPEQEQTLHPLQNEGPELVRDSHT